jgi:hypothetical protein
LLGLIYILCLFWCGLWWFMAERLWWFLGVDCDDFWVWFVKIFWVWCVGSWCIGLILDGFEKKNKNDFCEGFLCRRLSVGLWRIFPSLVFRWRRKVPEEEEVVGGRRRSFSGRISGQNKRDLAWRSRTPSPSKSLPPQTYDHILHRPPLTKISIIKIISFIINYINIYKKRKKKSRPKKKIQTKYIYIYKIWTVWSQTIQN